MLRRPQPRPRGFSPPRSIRPRSARAPLGEKTRSAQRNIAFKTSKKFKKSYFPRQSPFARKALCITGRAGPLACAAAAVYPAIHNSRPAAAPHSNIKP